MSVALVTTVPHPSSGSGGNRVVADRRETQAIAARALPSQTESSRHMPRWVTRVASQAVSRIATFYRYNFDPDYAEVEALMKSADVDRISAKLLSLCRTGPENLLRYSLSLVVRQSPIPPQRSAVEALRPLLTHESLTPADLLAIHEAGPSSFREWLGPIAVFFERKSCSLTLMQAFFDTFKDAFFNTGYEQLPLDIVIKLNENPSVLNVFFDVYPSIIKENSPLHTWVIVAVGKGLIDSLIGIKQSANLEAFKVYCDHDDGGLLPYLHKLWINETPSNKQQLQPRNLQDFAANHPQFRGLIACFLFIVIFRFEEDKMSQKQLADAFKAFLSLKIYLPDLWLQTFSWKETYELYLLARDDLIFSEEQATKSFAKLAKTLSKLVERFNPTERIFFEFSLRTMTELFLVATKTLSEDEKENPRLLIAYALRQWVKRKEVKGELIEISHERKKVVLSPSLAMALLNGSKDITWDELTAQRRTIGCTLGEETGSVTLSALEQKLLVDYSDVFSGSFSGKRQAKAINGADSQSIADLIACLANPFLTFTDADEAIYILSIADFFRAPSLVDRTVTWLNNHFMALRTEEEREAFVQTLLREDSPIGHLQVLRKIEAGIAYKQQVEERLKPV